MKRDVFVDTSAFYAIHDRDDARHVDAARAWNALLDGTIDGGVRCRTHSSVVVETSALVQRRLGIEALRDLHHATLPMVEISWVDEPLHGRAVAALLAAGRRDVSLVDWTSFEFMRSCGITTAFAFEDDFGDQGFEQLSPG